MALLPKGKPMPSASHGAAVNDIANAILNSDPFLRAVNSANLPGGLLGKLPPLSLGRVEEHLAIPASEWDLAQWQFASELLGYWVDELQIQAHNLSLLHSPKRRGRPRKLETPLPSGLFSIGLLAPHAASKKAGRPKKWTVEQSILVADVVDGIRQAYGLKSNEAAIGKLLELIAEAQGTSIRSTFKEPIKKVKSILRNVAFRGRGLRSKLPR